MLSVLILSIFTLVCLIISLILDRDKTLEALKLGLRMFMNLLPPFITILILVSILLYFTPKEVLIKWFGKEAGAGGMLLAAVVGSISLIPGFIAFPLGSILSQNGVGYSVIGVFITTLMMVGVVTLPLEKKFFGFKVAVIRNILSFIGAIIIGVLIGVLWGVV